MSGPITSAGAQPNSTKYAVLSMGARQMTGLVTNRSPYRDGAVSYLVGKFYGGTRFDTIWDGLNREISQRLTDVRRAGFSAYPVITQTGLGPGAKNSFFSWKYIQNGEEVVTVLSDNGPDSGHPNGQIGYLSSTASSVISNPLFNKSVGAGFARFLGVNTELFFGDGIETKKVIGTSKTWQPNTVYNAGDLITDSNGKLQQMFSSPLVLNILSVQQFSVVDPSGATIQYVRLVLDDEMDFPANFGSVALAGLTTATWLNGTTLTGISPLANGNMLQGVTTVTHAAHPATADTGTATGVTITGTGTSGATQPTWATGQQASTADGTITWRCYGNPLKDWGVPAPVKKITVAPNDATELYWQPGAIYGPYAVILDSNEQVQGVFGGPLVSGFIEPTWNTSLGGTTPDGDFAWLNMGQPGSWFQSTSYQVNSCILDTNGNIQLMQGGASPFTSGTTVPTWATTPGTTTTDNEINWTCMGPGAQLLFGSLQYAASWHSIDGTVTTAGPVNATVIHGILGNAQPEGFALQITGANPISDGLTADQASQIDQLWLWRTAEGESTLINVAQFPVDDVNAGTWKFLDLLPDTSLNAFIAAPVADSADPPLSNMTAPVYYLNRVWGIVDNMVVYSQGPDAIVGNGNTQFPPLNFIPYASRPIRLIPVTIQGGALVVMTTDGVYIILGTGTSSDPFYTTVYYSSVNVLNYNAIDVFNNAIFCMEANYKVSMMAIEYPFNPQTGYTEIGFPIADQFVQLSTGGLRDPDFNPSSSYLSWHNATSAEEAMFVCSGTGQWFRFSMINPPESGFLWSPLGQIRSSADDAGGGAMQSIETTPGFYQLLTCSFDEDGNNNMLFRDTDVNGDFDAFTDDYLTYPAWDAKGVTELGQWAGVAHISTKSRAVGTRPVVSVLFNEIEPSAERPYSILKLGEKSNDPPRNRRSLSAYSDRYVLAQNGMERTGDCLLTLFDYGEQNEPDELYDWGIFATVHDEREEAAAKV